MLGRGDLASADAVRTGRGTAAAGAGEGFSVEVDCIDDAEWDAIAGAFDDINPEQTACYARHHWKGRDSHLLLRRDGEPVAGARVAVIRLPVVGRGLAFLRFGPFWRRHDGDADPDVYHAMIAALIEEYCKVRGCCLTILPRPHPDYHPQECEWLREDGFARRREFDDRERYLVDVTLDDTAQTQSLSKRWRYNLRQAPAEGLEIRLTEDPAEIRQFQALYAGMVERKHFSSNSPVHLTEELTRALPPAIRPRLVIGSHQGKLVVGATIGLFGDTAYYMFGATAAEALPLQAGYALQWWIWHWLREQGYRWYDLGGAAHEPGLRQFKKGFSGKAGRTVVMEGEYDIWTRPVDRLSADAILNLRYLMRRLRYGAKFGSLGKAPS